MAIIGPANNKPVIWLTPNLQRCSYQPFIGTGSEPQGWHYFADPISNNTVCCFNIGGLNTGEVFFSKEPTVIQAQYERGPTSYTVPVTTFNDTYGCYIASTNGTNSGAIDPITQIDIGAFNNLFSDADSMRLIVEFLGGQHQNPFEPGGISGTGGGNGSFSLTSDPVDFPSVPTLSATDAGFVSLWIPTPVELRNLARYMWNTDLLTTDFWKKLVGDPIDLILSLAIYPTVIDVENDPKSVTVGFVNTGVSMHYRTSQYIDVDCGTLSIPEYWAAYMDYAPYTRVSIFLPYIGTKPLNTDDVMNQELSIRYRIDLVSGSCVAMIKVGDRIMYQFSGTCATAIPVSSEQMGNIIRATVSLGTALGATAAAVASGGVTAGAAADAISSAANLATTKPDVAHSSHVGAAAGLLSVQIPYLIIERPRQAIPEEQQTYTGFPSFITEDLGELTGYTEVEAIHLHDMTCTDDERAEIDELLKQGVIF